MKIVISGTPGTGKTTVAKILSKKTNLQHIDVNKVVSEHGLVKEDIVNIEKLEEVLKEMEGIIEGHLTCEMRLNDKIFVLRCKPDILKQRLLPRNYSKKKLKNNIESEALDYCTIVAEKNYKKVYEIDTSDRTPEEVAEIILRILAGEEWKEHIDWSEYFMNQEQFL